MTTLIVLSSIIAAILIVPLFMRKVHHVQRGIVVNVPAQKAFDYLKLLRNHEKFNKWAATDPNRKEECTGVDGTVGFLYAWSGNKSAGKGEKQIMDMTEGKRIEVEMRFTKPLSVTARFVIVTESLSDSQTRVTWSNTSALNYPLNIFVPMIEKSLAKDMDESLGNLKDLLEQQ